MHHKLMFNGALLAEKIKTQSGGIPRFALSLCFFFWDACRIGALHAPTELFSQTSVSIAHQTHVHMLSTTESFFKKLHLTPQISVDGAWSTWEPWESCSTSCGPGTRLRKRKCDNPEPQYGGQPCPGDSSETEDCNDLSCPGEHKSSYEISFTLNRIVLRQFHNLQLCSHEL